jgi:hypothetical protein
MDFFVQTPGRRYHLVAVVNDGQVALSSGLFNVSPVIRAAAIAEAQREHAIFMNRLFIKIPGTVQDLRTLEGYALHENQSACPQPEETDLPTLITVAELAMELEIPGVVTLVASHVSQVLEQALEDGEDVRDYPVLNLCQLAQKTNNKKLLDTIAWWFLNAARATRSQRDALWALHIGEAVRKETGYLGLHTYGMYLCVAWGAFRHPEAPRLKLATSSAVHSAQIKLVGFMEGLATPQLDEEHDHQVCVGAEVRRRCVDHWQAVWRQAHQLASRRICDEYKGTSFNGPQRDVLRMLRLMIEGLEGITQTTPGSLVSPACDLKRLHKSNGWLLKYQDMVKSIVSHRELPQMVALYV